MHRHADLYQKSLGCYLNDPVLNQVCFELWMKMANKYLSTALIDG